MSEPNEPKSQDAALDMGDSKMSVEDQQKLAKQLRKPEGEAGLKTAELMNETNLSMTLAAFEMLRISEGDQILEIGFGNGDHVEELVRSSEGLRYTGVDISESMVTEAKERNKNLIQDGTASFHLGDGLSIQLDDKTFQHVITVNTIYFWENPETYLQDIARVMAPGADLAIAYVTREFMEKLPFTQYGFTKVDDKDVEALSLKAELKVLDISQHTDEVKDKTGQSTTRTFAVASLHKPLDG